MSLQETTDKPQEVSHMYQHEGAIDGVKWECVFQKDFNILNIWTQEFELPL